MFVHVWPSSWCSARLLRWTTAIAFLLEKWATCENCRWPVVSTIRTTLVECKKNGARGPVDFIVGCCFAFLYDFVNTAQKVSKQAFWDDSDDRWSVWPAPKTAGDCADWLRSLCYVLLCAKSKWKQRSMFQLLWLLKSSIWDIFTEIIHNLV